MDVFNIYKAELNRELLTKEEEKELSSRIKNGDKDAIEELINANLPLVIYMAKSYNVSETEFDDIIQEGNLGLMRAAQGYDAEKGRFASYARLWIKSYINAYLNKNSHEEQVPIEDKKVLMVEDTERVEDSIEKLEGIGTLKDILECFLTKEERYVLSSRFGLLGAEVKTIKTLSKELGYSLDKVWRIEEGAIRKLRHPLASKFLKEIRR